MIRRLSMTAGLTLVSLLILSPALPAFAASSHSNLVGSVTVTSSVLISSYTKGSLTYYNFSDAFSFTGDIVGTCTGSDSGFDGVGPGGNYGMFAGQCTLVGTVGSVPGTMVISFKSPVGSEDQGRNLLSFFFSGGQGTGELAAATIRNGYADITNQYTANFQAS